MTTPTAETSTGSSASHPLLDAARAGLPEIVELRRRLHRIPEVGLALPETQAMVAEAVRGLGLEPRLGTTVGSVVAVIEGSGPGRTILLRADMDALPLTEDTGLGFSSDHSGQMHACGHDTHVAMLMGAAKLLIERRASWPGRVLLMFQPGEEGFHGARFMLEEGLLDASGSERPSGAFALHISTMYRTGTIDVRPGPMLAAGDTLRITVRGRGGHASAPHLSLDPITVAAQLLIALQAMVTRQVDVFDPAVVTIAQIQGGTTTNIIPETVFLGGTMRTVSADTRTAVRANIRQVAAGIAAATGAEIEVEIEPGYPVTVNDADFTAVVVDVARGLLGDDDVIVVPAPIMGAEDFSYVLEEVPGTIAFVGARPAGLDPATAPMNHSNRVVFDESAMAVGAATYAAVALRHLGAG
jgi:hippurate hydrolase